MEKFQAIDLLEELQYKVQEMREDGDNDLRTVLYLLQEAKRKVEML